MFNPSPCCKTAGLQARESEMEARGMIALAYRPKRLQAAKDSPGDSDKLETSEPIRDVASRYGKNPTA